VTPGPKKNQQFPISVIKENETSFGGKALSIQSSSGDSTLKNMMSS
jgi:hypothetical protein